jgi:hypothetical protein
MEFRYCSSYFQNRLLSCFLLNVSAKLSSKVFKTCIACCISQQKSFKKRKALQPLNLNIPSKKPAINCLKPIEAPLIPPLYIQSKTHLEYPLPLPKLHLQAPLLIPPLILKSPPPPSPPPVQPVGFLLVD